MTPTKFLRCHHRALINECSPSLMFSSASSGWGRHRDFHGWPHGSLSRPATRRRPRRQASQRIRGRPRRRHLAAARRRPRRQFSNMSFEGDPTYSTRYGRAPAYRQSHHTGHLGHYLREFALHPTELLLVCGEYCTQQRQACRPAGYGTPWPRLHSRGGRSHSATPNMPTLKQRIYLPLSAFAATPCYRQALKERLMRGEQTCDEQHVRGFIDFAQFSTMSTKASWTGPRTETTNYLTLRQLRPVPCPTSRSCISMRERTRMRVSGIRTYVYSLRAPSKSQSDSFKSTSSCRTARMATGGVRGLRTVHELLGERDASERQLHAHDVLVAPHGTKADPMQRPNVCDAYMIATNPTLAATRAKNEGGWEPAVLPSPL